jgi:hypothetical protein
MMATWCQNSPGASRLSLKPPSHWRETGSATFRLPRNLSHLIGRVTTPTDRAPGTPSQTSTSFRIRPLVDLSIRIDGPTTVLLRAVQIPGVACRSRSPSNLHFFPQALQPRPKKPRSSGHGLHRYRSWRQGEEGRGRAEGRRSQEEVGVAVHEGRTPVPRRPYWPLPQGWPLRTAYRHRRSGLPRRCPRVPRR